jgi:hypothetical protein
VAGISTYLIDKYLDALVNASGFNVAAVYAKLHTGDPGSAGTANAAANTTRKSLTVAAASAGSKATSADLIWTAVPNAETYTHVSLWDDPAAGNYLWSQALTASKTVSVGDTFEILSGQLTLAIT